MRELDKSILINPTGCFLSFLDFFYEKDSLQKQNKCFDWIRSQTLYQPDHHYSVLLGRLGNGSGVSPSLGGCIQAFKSMGWAESPLFITMRQAVRDLYSAHMIHPVKSAENDDDTEVILTSLGAELYSQGNYLTYLSSLSAVADYWRSSCFKVFRRNESGIGSGFVVGDNLIATCRHVVDDVEVGDLIAEDENGNQFEVDAVYFHPEKGCDLAAIRAKRNLGRRVLEVGQRPSLIDPVVIFGFPPVPHTTEAILLCNRGEVTALTDKVFGHKSQKQGKLDHLFPDTDNGFKPSVLILSSLLRPGNSGGPVLNRYGLVVGVVSKNLQERLPDFAGGDFSSVDLNRGVGYAAAISAEHLNAVLALANS